MLDFALIILHLEREMQIRLYTDGACDIHAENKPGGWAAILQATNEAGELVKERVASGGAERTTNNQMELNAVVEGLKLLTSPATLTVYSDSRYVIDIARGTKKPAKNRKLWRTYFELAARHMIDWKYVAGHSGDALNERCDRLAVAERRKSAKPAPRATTATDSAIQVYLSTQINRKSKTAAWAAIIVQGGVDREASGRQERVSELEATLIGAIRCLEGLPPGQSATLFTAQEYLSKGMNQWLAGWEAKGWKTRAGEPVKYRGHWQTLQALARGRRLEIRFVKQRQAILIFSAARNWLPSVCSTLDRGCGIFGGLQVGQDAGSRRCHHTQDELRPSARPFSPRLINWRRSIRRSTWARAGPTLMARKKSLTRPSRR